MFQFPYPTGIVEGLALEGWRTKVTVRDGRVGSAHHPECIGQRTAVSRAHLDRGASFTRDSRTEPPYERSTLKSPVNALTGFIQKSSDVHIHESCPCSESRSFRNLDSATGKIHFARLDANPMSSRLAPKVANEVSHGRKFNSNYRRFHAGTGPLIAVGANLSHESYVPALPFARRTLDEWLKKGLEQPSQSSRNALPAIVERTLRIGPASLRYSGVLQGVPRA